MLRRSALSCERANERLQVYDKLLPRELLYHFFTRVQGFRKRAQRLFTRVCRRQLVGAWTTTIASAAAHAHRLTSRMNGSTSNLNAKE